MPTAQYRCSFLRVWLGQQEPTGRTLLGWPEISGISYRRRCNFGCHIRIINLELNTDAAGLTHMNSRRIDGKIIAQSVMDEVAKQIIDLRSDDIRPCLATVLVGDDQASATYVRNKHKACSRVGIETKDHRLSSSTSQESLAGLVSSLNDDRTVHGIVR